jgi:8-oxo-dGTP pyrophosphatase MutT (NUDIX family)
MEMIEHHSAGAVVFIDQRALVLRRGDRNEWVFPKGHLERGEEPQDAALREVREETGRLLTHPEDRETLARAIASMNEASP